MLKSNLIFTFLFFQIILFGQSKISPIEVTFDKKNIPQKIKKITQFKNDTIVNIREYDSLKNLIFSHTKEYIGEYWNDKYITTIRGKLYGTKNEISKSYYLHSNVGIDINYHEYNKKGLEKKLYSKNNAFEDNEQLINTNPYSFISKIESINDLIKNEKINKIEEIADKYLQKEKEYDSIGNLITEVLFDISNEKTSSERFFYDDENNLIYSFCEGFYQNIWEFFYSYDRNRLAQNTRMSYDKNNILKEIDYMIFYKYDDKNRLIEEITYSGGKIESKYVYEYEKENRVKKLITFLYNSKKPTIVQKFYYNQKGSLIKEKTRDYRSNERITNKYLYSYEYYK